MTTRRWLVAGFAGLALVLLAGRAAATVYMSYQWYQAMGAAPVWRARAANAALLHLLFGSLGVVFVFLNLNWVRGTVVSLVVPRRVANLEIGEEVPSRSLLSLLVMVSVAVGGLLSITGDPWTVLEAARHGLPFQESDPYFALDLGFYVHWLPFEEACYSWAVITWIVVAVLVIVLYAVTRSLRWERRRLRVSAHARRHLSFLGAVLLLLLGWSYRLDAYGGLSFGHGADGAYSYIDNKVVLLARLALAMVSVVAAALVAWAGWVGRLRTAFWTITALLALSVGLTSILPGAALRLMGPVDPVARERPYLAIRAGYSRRAFGIDRIQRGGTEAAAGTGSDLARRISAWESAPLARAAERGGPGERAGRRVAWEEGPAGPVARILLSAGTEQAATIQWTSFRALQFVAEGADSSSGRRGAGAPLGPVLVQDSARGDLVLADSTGRIPGVALDGGLARLALAWSAQNFRLLLGDLPRPSPRAIIHRDVRERVRALAPFFAQGRSVEPVLDGDSLYWALDLYAASADYPLSRRVPVGDDEWSYYQHAATALVQAATGRVLLVADSVSDPLARSWITRFPSIFVSWSAVAPSLAARVPPDIDGATIQATVFAHYGSRTEGSTARQLPPVDGGDSLARGAPTPVEFTASAGAEPRLAWTVPLLDGGDRVAGLIVATGGASRGTLWFPIERPPSGLRWHALVDRLAQAGSGISAADSNRGGAGNGSDSPLVRGRLRCLPFRDTAACVQTLYEWPRDGAPSIARVLVVMADSVLSGATLAEALHLPPEGRAARTGPLSPAEFRMRVSALYEQMRAAMRRGDWTSFGKAYQELGALLGQPPR